MERLKRRSSPLKSLFRHQIALLVAFTVGVLPQLLNAQVVYNPMHPDVEEMVRKGMRYLEEHPQGNPGEAVLSAMTIIEATKRYERIVPSQHPLVTRAVSRVLDDIQLLSEKDGNDSPLRGGGLYYIALSIILLLDIGDEQYRPQIEALVAEMFLKRTQHGAYSYTKDQPSDSSQSQYAALAFAVLKLHGFKVYTTEAKDLLEWFCRAQTPEGSWYYHYFGTNIVPRGDSTLRGSRHATGASSIYVLSDLLNLNNRKKGVNAAGNALGVLPPSVSVYVPPDRERDPLAEQTGPLVSFDAGLLSSTKAKSNRWLATNFNLSLDEAWNYYFMYGLERYAYFREKSEGRITEIPDWYDQGVEFLKANQGTNGGWPPATGGGEQSTSNSTCFAILFLVRASELLMDDAANSTVKGGLGFQENQKLENKGGDVVADQMVKGFQNIMTLLKNAKSEDDIAMLMDALGPAIKEFTEDKDKSRTEQLQFLRGLMTEESYMKRKIAVRFVAATQDLDNVPALLYALSDPALDICEEAHNGLRLISRKVDAFPLSANPTKVEFLDLKAKWTKWYKGIRPDAKLIDE